MFADKLIIVHLGVALTRIDWEPVTVTNAGSVDHCNLVEVIVAGAPGTV